MHFSLPMPVSYGPSGLLKLSGNGLESFMGLWWSLWPPNDDQSWWLGWPLVNIPGLIPAHLCCMVLCLSPGAQTRTLVSAKCCPSSVWPLLQKHPDLSERMLLPTILGWLHSYLVIGVWEYILVLLSSRLLHGHRSWRSEPNLRKTKYSLVISERAMHLFLICKLS